MYFTKSSGMPAGENNHRIVVVSDCPDKASWLLDLELKKIGWRQESKEWIWGGSGNQSFASASEAIDFANWLMGEELDEK